MKAVLCVQPGRLEIIERPMPAAEEGLVPVDIRAVGICGTDFHIYQGTHPFLEYPRVMGHELSGVVAEGSTAEGLAPGTRVVINPYLSCGHCIACRKGKTNCCATLQVLGVHIDGGMCERILMPAGNLYPANDISLRDAAMVEFQAIGAHAVRRAGPAGGGRALVVGAGPIGLGTALFARIAGFDVTFSDVSEERLAAARDRFGFESSLVAGDTALAAGLSMTGSEGFDAVFDATGKARSMNAALPFVAHGGVLVYVSVVKDEITFADPEFHKREMMVIGSRNATRADFEHVADSIARGLVPVDQLITHRTTLADAPRDLARWAHEKSGLIKAVIRVAG